MGVYRIVDMLCYYLNSPSQIYRSMQWQLLWNYTHASWTNKSAKKYWSKL